MVTAASHSARGSIAYEPCWQDGHSHDWRDCPTPEGLLDPFPNIPEGWRVLWCDKCLYAVTFTADDAETYGNEWWPVLDEAVIHDHS